MIHCIGALLLPIAKIFTCHWLCVYNDGRSRNVLVVGAVSTVQGCALFFVFSHFSSFAWPVLWVFFVCTLSIFFCCAFFQLPCAFVLFLCFSVVFVAFFP